MSLTARLHRLGAVDALAIRSPSGRLDDLILDDPNDPSPKLGDVFAARVQRALPGGAAMLDLGDGLRGYLPDADGRAAGASLLAQVRTPAQGDKAPRMSARPEIAGRWATATMGAPGVNVSRKLAAATRAALVDRLASVPLDAADGIVVRTAAGDAPAQALEAEAGRLAAALSALRETALAPPRRVATGPTLSDRALRSRGLTAEAATPGDDDRVRDEIRALLRVRTPLVGPGLSGAWMAIEPTEALVAIDVNPGAAAGLAANLAAAAETPRQLRLRGLAGQICIDFAPLAPSDRGAAEAALARAADAALKPVGYGPLGLLEAVRKRDRPSLAAMAPRMALEA